MTNILKIFESRSSVRKFKTDEVANELIQKAIYAASLAPTARNVQPWKFVVVKNSSVRNQIASLASQNAPFIKDAPVCVAVVCDDTKYYLEDGCSATTQLLLCAAGLGLGACWVAADKKEYCSQIADLLHIPNGMKLVSLVALGYPQEIVKAIKKPIDELIHNEVY
ncbi:MAG: nitroreductase family protein [Candidatus Omnitrophota bacterium]